MSSLQSLLHLLPLLPPKQRTENLSTCILPTPTPYKQGQWTDTHLGREHRMSPPFFFFLYKHGRWTLTSAENRKSLHLCTPTPYKQEQWTLTWAENTECLHLFSFYKHERWPLTSAENRKSLYLHPPTP